MGILSPDEILKRSSPSMHNEIVALGQSGLKAVGFFYKVNSQRYPINVDLMTAMYQLGGRMGLPVVGISNEKENPYDENKVIRSMPAESGEEEASQNIVPLIEILELRLFLRQKKLQPR